MAALSVSCPECGEKFKVSSPSDRKKITCPECAEVFSIGLNGAAAGAMTRGGRDRRADRDEDDADERDLDEDRVEDNEEDDEDDAPTPARRKQGNAAKNPALLWAAYGLGAVALAGLGVLLAYLVSPRQQTPVVVQAPPKVEPVKKDLPPIDPPIHIDPFPKPKFDPKDIIKIDFPKIDLPKIDFPKIDPFPKIDLPKDDPKLGPIDDGPRIPVIIKDIPKFDLPPAKDRPLLVLDPEGHSGKVADVSFSHDGKSLITLGTDRSVRFWDVATGEQQRVLRLPSGPGDEGLLMSAALSPSGARLAVSALPISGGVPAPVYIIALETGKIERVLSGHSQPVVGLAYSPNGQWLATAGLDGAAGLVKIGAWEKFKLLKGHGADVRRVAFSADSTVLASLSARDKSVRLWQVSSAAPVAVLPELPQPLSLSWHPKLQVLAIATQTGEVLRYNLVGGTKPQQISRQELEPGQKFDVTDLAYHPNGNDLLYTGIAHKSHAGIFSVSAKKNALKFSEHNNTVMAGALSPNGKLAATTGGDDHETFIWDTTSGKVLHKIVGLGKSVWAVGWRLDGQGFAFGTTNRGSTMQATTPVERTFVPGDLDYGDEPADIGRIISKLGAYQLETIDFFKISVKRNGQAIFAWKSPIEGDRLYSMTMLPGDRAVIGGSFGLYLIDVRDGKLLRSFRGHSGIIMGVSPSPDGRHFLSGSTDQTISLWDPDRDDPLLSFFFAGREWVAWTPMGYYACSANGERLMGWQLSKGPAAMGVYHPAARFHQSLYYPELIQAIFLEKDLGKAWVRAAQSRPDRIAAQQLNQVLPPKVEVTSFENVKDNVIKAAALEVKVKAESVGEHPVTALRLLVDGRPYKGHDSLRMFPNPKLGAVETSWNVNLLPGKHTLAVIAESKVSKALSPVVEVTREGGEEELPSLFMLASGISEYPGPLALNYAHRDAIVLSETLREKSKGVFKQVETRLLADRDGTRKNILEGLLWLEKVMTDKDVAIIFLAGHGDRDKTGKFHFLPVDGDMRRPYVTFVSDDSLKKTLGKLPGRVVVMLDACHSGAASSPSAKNAKKSLADDLVRDLVSEDFGVIVMCSSLGREYSMESRDTQHGFFTLGLLEALRGKGDYNQDGYVYLHEMDFYAANRVRQLSTGRQNPVTARPANIRSFPLGKLQ